MRTTCSKARDLLTSQALMELGSQVCKPAAPECAACPLQSSCKGYAEVRASGAGVPVSHMLSYRSCPVRPRPHRTGATCASRSRLRHSGYPA